MAEKDKNKEVLDLDFESLPDSDFNSFPDLEFDDVKKKDISGAPYTGGSYPFSPNYDTEQFPLNQEGVILADKPKKEVSEPEQKAEPEKIDNTKKAQEIRPFSRDNGEGSESTHLMAAETFDGKNWYGFPTIFPKEGNKDSRDPKDWIDYGDDRKGAFEEAKKRDELNGGNAGIQYAKSFLPRRIRIRNG